MSEFIRNATASLDTQFHEHLQWVFNRNEKEGMSYLRALASQGMQHEWNGEKFEQSDLVVAGCSFTTTVGVEYQKLWGTQLSELLGVDYVNISVIGWSMNSIVTNLIEHLDTRKNKPKYVAVLGTELFRMATPLNIKATNSRISETVSHDVVDINFTHRENMSVTVKYSKRPHIVEDVTSLDAAFHQSLSAITQLNQYCRAAGIKFVWGTWDTLATEFYSQIIKTGSPIDLGNYIELPTYHPSDRYDNLPQECHMQDREQYQESFYFGTDNGTHAGVHHNAHWAEAFYASLQKQ